MPKTEYALLRLEQIGGITIYVAGNGWFIAFYDNNICPDRKVLAKSRYLDEVRNQIYAHLKEATLEIPAVWMVHDYRREGWVEEANPCNLVPGKIIRKSYDGTKVLFRVDDNVPCLWDEHDRVEWVDLDSVFITDDMSIFDEYNNTMIAYYEAHDLTFKEMQKLQEKYSVEATGMPEVPAI
jgi:hypothetical protein